MTTTKSYTDINQSKKLAEILPLESADMIFIHTIDLEGDEHYDIDFRNKNPLFEDDVCAWSLAALLGILSIIKGYRVEIRHIDKGYCCCYTEENHDGDLYWYYADNPIDACVDMIEKLNELKML